MSGLIEDKLSQHLFDPLHELLSHKRDSHRSDLIELGYELASGQTISRDHIDFIERGTQALEALNMQCLIVKDSDLVKAAVPLALNSAHWLSAFASRLILDSEVSNVVKNNCLSDLTDALLKFHQAQTLDLSVKMNEQLISDAPVLCCQSLEWKSGALMELGLVLGAHLAGCEGPRLNSLRMLGRELGIATQMLEDLFMLDTTNENKSELAELAQQKPSFVWWLIAEEFPEQWGAFRETVELLPDNTEALSEFVATYPLYKKGLARVRGHQRWTFQNFATLGGDLTSPGIQKLEGYFEKIVNP